MANENIPQLRTGTAGQDPQQSQDPQSDGNNAVPTPPVEANSNPVNPPGTTSQEGSETNPEPPEPTLEGTPFEGCPVSADFVAAAHEYDPGTNGVQEAEFWTTAPDNDLRTYGRF